MQQEEVQQTQQAQVIEQAQPIQEEQPEMDESQMCNLHKSPYKYFCTEKICTYPNRFVCYKCVLVDKETDPENVKIQQVIEIDEFNKLKNEKINQIKLMLEQQKALDEQKAVDPKNEMKQLDEILSKAEIKTEYQLANNEIKTFFQRIRENFNKFIDEQETTMINSYNKYYNTYYGTQKDNQMVEQMQEQKEQLLKPDETQDSTTSAQVESFQNKIKMLDLDNCSLITQQKEQQDQFADIIFRYTPVLENTQPTLNMQTQKIKSEKQYLLHRIQHSYKSQKLLKVFQSVDKSINDAQLQASNVIKSHQIQDKNELKIGTKPIKIKSKIFLHPQYNNFAQSKIEFLNSNIVMYSNSVKDKHPPTYQLSRIHINNGFQENLASFDREVVTFAQINEQIVLLGLSRFDQLYMYEPNVEMDKLQAQSTTPIQNSQIQPVQLVPVQLNLFESKGLQPHIPRTINTTSIQRVNSYQFLVSQNCQFKRHRNDGGFPRLLEVLALGQIYQNPETKEKKIWKAIEYDVFEGRVQKILFLNDGQDFIAFYNQKSENYYDNSFITFARIYKITEQSPKATIQISKNYEIGQVTCCEKLDDSTFILGTFYEFMIVHIDVETSKATILDKQQSSQSIYRPMCYQKDHFCFYDGYKTQFWRVINGKLYEDKKFSDPALLTHKNADYDKIVSLNIIPDQNNQGNNFLCLEEWDSIQEVVPEEEIVPKQEVQANPIGEANQTQVNGTLQPQLPQ